MINPSGQLTSHQHNLARELSHKHISGRTNGPITVSSTAAKNPEKLMKTGNSNKTTNTLPVSMKKKKERTQEAAVAPTTTDGEEDRELLLAAASANIFD